MVLDLTVDPLDEPSPYRLWGDQDSPVTGGATEPGQVVEQVCDVLGDDPVAGEQAEVLVQPGGLRVVVAGPDVHVASQPVGLVADNEGQLAVSLQADDAVHDVAAGVLQLA